MFDWYYTRIYVYVRPERVFVWSDGDFSAEPTLYGSHIEEVRSQHSAEPRGAAAGARGRRRRVGRAHGRARAAATRRRC